MEQNNHIYTKRLLLRPLNISDLDTAFVYSSDRQVTRYMMFYPHDTLEETRQFLENVTADWESDAPPAYEFAVMLQEKHIGSVTLYVLDEQRKEGELAWMLLREYQGMGYATEAASALLEYAFKEVGMTRVIAQCDVRNAASERVMKKLGMKLADADGERIYPKTGEQSVELTYEIGF